MTVTGNPGKIIHQGIFGVGDPIEKSRFADIGTADNGNNGFHAKFYFNLNVLPENNTN
jgi:hypothetical protein